MAFRWAALTRAKNQGRALPLVLRRSSFPHTLTSDATSQDEDAVILLSARSKYGLLAGTKVCVLVIVLLISSECLRLN